MRKMPSVFRAGVPVGVVVAACLIAVFGICVAAEPSEQFKQQRDEQRRQYEQHFKQLKSLGTYKMDEVCRVVQERGDLEVRTKLPSTRPGQYRVQVEGLDGYVTVSVYGQVVDGRPQNFNLQVISFADPEKMQVNTSLSYNSGILSLSRSWQNDRGYSSVSLQQIRPTNENVGMPPGVQFNVQDQTSTGGMRAQVNAQAPDFATLRRSHARQMDEYLRPMLREMRAESMMAPDPIVAWQVFADQWRPDDKIAQRIADILPRLDADDFGEREAALADLRQVGKAGALAIHHMKKDQLTAQQNTLIDSFLSDYHTMSVADATLLRKDREFLLDCMYSDDAAIRTTAAAALNGLGVKLAIEPNADLDARAAAVARIRSGPATSPASQPATQPRV